MYNGFHLPNNQINTQVFQPIGGTIQPWRKPTGAKLIHIICIGAGGGGGGGFTRAAGVAGGGGGGGGSAAITRMTIDASLIPDMLYIAVGMGGAGSTGAGATGGASVVYMPLVSGFTGAGSILLQAAAGAGGGVGTTAVGGPAGAAGAINTSNTWSGLGNFVSIAGQPGIIGGAITAVVPTAVVWGTLFISGGAGGGGVTAANVAAAGGNITGPAGNSILSTVFGGGNTGLPGGQGYDLFGAPPISSGGSGGGAFGTGPGGRGGDGGFGSGGAGGGSGTTGGRGGNGGNGRVIITSI